MQVMRSVAVQLGLLWVGATALGACTATDAHEQTATGSMRWNLVGTGPSGTTYRLRDAIIAVDGPTSTVFNTEDDPDATTLSADVPVGNYASTLQPGWRLERLDGGSTTNVKATLISDNPAYFAVESQLRTDVPLRFRVDGGDVDFSQGYDITLDVLESVTAEDGYQAISAPSPRARLVYDAGRNSVYGVNLVDQDIERFTLDAGTWKAAAPLVVADLTDIALTPNGETLIVLTRDAVSDIALAGPFSPVKRADNPDPFCGAYFRMAGAASNGKVLLVRDYGGCSGFTQSYFYDTNSHALSAYVSLYRGTVGASADGTRLYLGSNGISPADTVDIYNAPANTLSSSSVAANLFAVSASANASKVILQNHQVYSASLTQLGNLPGDGTALVSRDAHRAFFYHEDGLAGPRLDIYDLDGDLLPGAYFPRLRTLALPNAANATPGYPSAVMTSNADDSFVFISGDRRVLVVPVQ